MLGSIRDWLLGLTAASLAGHLVLEASGVGRRSEEVRCTKITVVDDQGRPRVVLDGSADDWLISVLDDAGTRRLVVSMQQEPDEKLIDSTIRLELRDHEGRRSLELVQEGNHSHGGSARLGIYGVDGERTSEWTAMFGTSVMAGWPHLEIFPSGGGSVFLGLRDYGEPSLEMSQSPNKAGTHPVLVERRTPDEMGSFSLRPGRVGQTLIDADEELVRQERER